MGKRAQCTLYAVVLIAALAGPAQAGNGNGKSNGNGKPDATPTEQTASPGNSAEAPGQVKKDAEASAPAPAPHGQDTKPSASASHHASAPAPSPGVKPSNSTAKHTDAPAGSNRTKLYGNGKTAGQIAMQHGYPASGNLYGPGNSQPHKVVTCGHRHGVDVHALKSHPAKSCGRPPSATHRSDPPPSNDPHGVTPHGSPTTSASAPSAAVEHEHESGASANGGIQPVSDVLAGTLAVGGASLPFTGVPLWAVALGALILVGAGLSLRALAQSA
jgi:hypothetical protein